MAIVWQHNHLGVCYEVRSAGASLRLYTNGAFHSQHNPGFVFTGAVWDLLSLPSLAPACTTNRSLILGVGGGTVIHQLNKLKPPKEIIGLELDPVHLQVATQQFQLIYPNLQLVQCDARDWMQQRSSDGDVDYLVDDIFLHGETDAARPFAPDKDWLALLARQLSPSGTLVQNHIDAHHAAAFLTQCRALIKQHFGSVYLFSNTGYANAILAFYRPRTTQQKMNASIAENLSQLRKKQTSRLRYRCRRLV